MSYHQPARKYRPSKSVSHLEDVVRDQANIIDVLKGALATQGMEFEDVAPDWMKGLSVQERALMGALLAAYPKAMNKYDLIDVMPARDHVEDRQVRVVVLKVCHIRKKLGVDAIETIRGVGFRISPAMRAKALAGERREDAGLKIAA